MVGLRVDEFAENALTSTIQGHAGLVAGGFDAEDSIQRVIRALH
jgi:hypothetical protein